METPLYHTIEGKSFFLRPAQEGDEATVRALSELGGMALASDWQQGTVAVDSETKTVVGYLRVQQTSQGPHVAPVAVRPDWRGCGVGRVLMENACAHHGPLKLVSQGCSVGFYRKIGCTEIPFESISNELEEDCAVCSDRASCQPVAFIYEGPAEQQLPAAPSIESKLQQARATFAETAEACTACGACTARCSLLANRGWSMRSLCDEGMAVVQRIESGVPLREALEGSDFLSFTLSCLGCERCTAVCPEGIVVTASWLRGRELARAAGILDDETLDIIKTDCTWNSFTKFRKMQGTSFDDLPQLCVEPIDAHEAGWTNPNAANFPENPQAETLFFPGCTLVSYAPELTRTAFAWLEEHQGPCLLGTQCCGSTLGFMGETERTRAWQERVIAAAQAQGVKRFVCVCPGCVTRLQPVAASMAPEIEFVSYAQLLMDAGVQVDAGVFAPSETPVMVIDSCNDRAGMHGNAIRQLFTGVENVLSPCRGADARCCGAGGGVNLYDQAFSRANTRYMLDLARDLGVHTLITACPTCSYTHALELMQSAREGITSWQDMGVRNYLEAAFGQRIDWAAVLDALMRMWQES